MTVLSTIAGSRALLFGLALVMLGNGLQGTLLGVRATIEGFPTTTTGFVMTGYYVGFLVGSLLVPRMLHNVGHIRVFAALASLASGAVLLHAVFPAPGPWAAFRLVTGFAYAGLYVVAESWLNDAASNETRGQLLSVYMVIVTGGIGAGQFLINLGAPGEFPLFVLVSVLVSFAVVPIALTVMPAPAFEAPAHIGVRELYHTSPLGAVGAVAVGAAHGSLFGMGAVYARSIGLPIADVAWFMALAAFGGMLSQWPIGWLSDVLDRRRVITGVALAAAVAAVGAAAIAPHSRAGLLVLVTALGGATLPLYSLVIAHTNDHLRREQIVAASSTLVLLAGCGAIAGPPVAGLCMAHFGAGGFFWLLGAVHAGIGGFALWRMLRRDAVPRGRQRHYGILSPRTTAVAASVAMGEVRDQRDRDLARWSQY